MMPQGRENGKYLYGFVADPNDRIYGPFGVEGGTVYTISNGHVAAVVSDIPKGKIRPQRRHLSAHHGVLRHIMNETGVLPISFGTIADGSEGILKLLARHQMALIEALDRVKGRVEMSLRIGWDVPNIFEHLVMARPELRRARDQVFHPHARRAKRDMIEIGRLFERILSEERDAHTEKVMEVLSTLCSDIKRAPLRNEKEVARLACLIERGAEKKFEAAVHEAASMFNGDLVFSYSGPWPPHSFVNLSINLGPDG